MVREGKYGNILRPEGNREQAELLGERHYPAEHSVGHDTGDRPRWIGLIQILYELLYVAFHIIQRLVKNLELIPSLELTGQAIGYSHKPNGETSIDTGIGIGVGDDVMPGLCEDKCDGNALGGNLLCELHHGNDMALPRQQAD